MPEKTATIRQNIKTILEAVPGLGATVSDTDAEPTDSSDLPKINIFTLNEVQDKQNKAYHPLHFRLMRGEVEIHAILSAQSASLGNDIDTLKGKVKDAIKANRTLDGAVTAIEYDRTDYDYSGVKTELPHVIAVMIFDVEYQE